MNIRPIDLQVLIPRATEVGKIQSATDQQSALQQQQFAAQMQAVAAARRTQVQGAPKSAQARVQREKENPRRHQQQPQGQPEETECDEGQALGEVDVPYEDPVRGRNIDIKT